MADRDRQFRILRMQPVTGGGQDDPRTEAPGAGEHASSAGPGMQAARGWEGTTVSLNQLEGMGRLSWQSGTRVRLDTAEESYLVDLEPQP